MARALVAALASALLCITPVLPNCTGVRLRCPHTLCQCPFDGRQVRRQRLLWCFMPPRPPARPREVQEGDTWGHATRHASMVAVRGVPCLIPGGGRGGAAGTGAGGICCRGPLRCGLVCLLALLALPLAAALLLTLARGRGVPR